MTQKRLEELTISCEQVIRTMKYNERPEARTRIGKVLLDSKGDLNHTKARYFTLQTRVMKLQKKMKRNNLILTKSDKGNNRGNAQR